ncbi:response regulator receiver modulated diguanylate cyclase [Candidatus Moduliflexus flocculans]|uniref:Response regulator receiver modulated diguanylate cyclase n=1 Tax=Candidatus Moduliflexus flocculans TaxID=1499966 RepID=A0A081BN29_9BACT|nr:response regulator receiver modulated diguanylate cyclase [Candidatus Moduliflexus flocculans]
MIPMMSLSSEKSTILVVDDYPANLHLLLESLKEAGYKVLIAINGESAIRQAGFAKPEIIMLDVMMPGMDGFETCRCLKQQPNTRDIPVIFMTALSETVDKLRGFEAGGVDYITKPLNIVELLARINVHLELKRAREELKKINQELQETNQKLLDSQQQLERMARIDPLTELANRRDMTERLEQEKQHSERSGASFAVVICDIDNFKQVNDNYGHDCGDIVLKSVARLLQANIRAQDHVARWGGEEFLLLLTDTNDSGAAKFAERVRAAIANEPYQYQNQALAITMTFGISMCQADKGIHLCLKEADQALYQGKEHGKNRVTVFRQTA